MKRRFVFAMSGASGPVVGLWVLRQVAASAEVHLVLSGQTFSILKEESGVDWQADEAAEVQARIRRDMGSDAIHYYRDHDLAARISSGSFRTDGMFVVPCSMKTLAGIAHGYTESLIQRAADVTIKEARPLVLSPREMPFSPIHLDNMLSLARIGVRIVPPLLSFYHRPATIDEMIDFVAGKILDAMGIGNDLFRRWGGRGDDA